MESSFESRIEGLTLEEATSAHKLLEQRIQTLRQATLPPQSMNSASSVLVEHDAISSIGPFSIDQKVPETIVIQGLDVEDCQNFLRDYLGQGEKYSGRRSKLSNAELIISREERIINFQLDGNGDVNATVAYNAESQELYFKIHQTNKKTDKVEPLASLLRQQLQTFFEKTYGTDQLLFKPQMLSEGKPVNFEEEIVETAAPLSSSADASHIGQIQTDPKESSSLALLADEEEGPNARKRSGSAGSKHSANSDPQTANIANNNFFMKAMVNTETAGLSFAISPLRPDTYLGRQQGAHITAYIIYVTAILETIDGENISEIPDLLVAAAMQFAPEAEWDSFRSKLDDLRTGTPFFQRTKRKDLTAALRDTVQEDTVQFLKKSMKVYYATVLCNFIDDLSNQILMAINQSENTLYARTGRKKTPKELGEEGSKVKNVMKKLRKISVDIDKDRERTKTLTEGVAASSIKDTQEPTKMQLLERNLRNRSKRGSDEPIEDVGQLIFDLFDYDYYEYTSSCILGKIESTILDHKKTLKKAAKSKQLDQGDLAITLEDIKKCDAILNTLHEIESIENSTERLRLLEEFGANPSNELTGQFKINASSQIAQVFTKVQENAPYIIGQHLKVVMNHAFPSLQYLPKAKWDVACEQFFNLVEKDRHWEEMPQVMEEARTLLPMHHTDIEKKDEDHQLDEGAPGLTLGMNL